MTQVLDSPKVDDAAVAAALEDLRDLGATGQAYIRAGGTNVCVNAVNAGGDGWSEYSEAASTRAATGGRRMLPVLGSGEVDGRFWIAYEVGSASSLADLRARHLLPTATSQRVLSDVARALDEAAAKGLFPSELRPDWVFVTEKAARLGDLGTAREGLAGAKLELEGDPAYVPPEVLRGKSAGERSGVYLYGALLHHLMTGAAPQRLSSSSRECPQPDLPASIKTIVATAMADDPSDRPHTVSEAHAMAQRALRGEPPARARMRRNAKAGAARRTFSPATASKRALRKGTGAKRATDETARAKRATRETATAQPASRKATTAKRVTRETAKAKPKAKRDSRETATAKRALFRETAGARRALSQAATATRAVSQTAKRSFLKAAAARPAIPKRDSARPPRRAAASPVTWRRVLGRGRAAATSVTWRRVLGGGRAAALPVTQRRVLGVGGALVLGAAAGLLLGASPDPEPARAQTVTAGGLSVTVPSGRHRVEPNGGGLAVRAPGSLFRARMVGSPLSPPLDARPVQLGRLQAWRHSAGGAVRYLVPTSGGTLAVTCRVTASASSRPLRVCERTASTLRLRDAKALPLAAVAEESRRLQTTIAGLEAKRDAARARLGSASTSKEQRLAAQDLADSHERAATELRGLTGAGSLEAAARGAADAYLRLAAAAESGSPERWSEASEQVGRSDAALAEAIAAMP